MGADLTQCSLQQALQGTGFDPVKPAVFLCEGLLYYLPQVRAVSHVVACLHMPRVPPVTCMRNSRKSLKWNKTQLHAFSQVQQGSAPPHDCASGMWNNALPYSDMQQLNPIRSATGK